MWINNENIEYRVYKKDQGIMNMKKYWIEKKKCGSFDAMERGFWKAPPAAIGCLDGQCTVESFSHSIFVSIQRDIDTRAHIYIFTAGYVYIYMNECMNVYKLGFIPRGFTTDTTITRSPMLDDLLNDRIIIMIHRIRLCDMRLDKHVINIRLSNDFFVFFLLYILMPIFRRGTKKKKKRIMIKS